MIGTVSPAGGKFEEPITQSTLATVKTFLGLSYDRAYKRFYPAVDPLLSWSRYLEQLTNWYDKNMEVGWTHRVRGMIDLLKRGDAILQMMHVTGEEGVTLDDIVRGVNEVGMAPGDIVAILEALKEAGALRAELIVI